eukprot:TRINITY_DN7179_c0_g1_i1.p1 TRINITY_DN7179_c0_g1~~TRINITY_DN7179_c0_g1_i1.p1  ORF type:complete len:426 (+),score=52.44 TRINITY_DN7179_c0_g1_i1:276-1553(+)
MELNRNLSSHLARAIAEVKASNRESGNRRLTDTSSLTSEVLAQIRSERMKKGGRVGLVHYNLGLSLYRRVGAVHHCNTLLEWMQTDNIKGNTETFSYVLGTYVSKYSTSTTSDDMMRIWKQMKSERVYPDAHCYSTVMQLAVKELESGVLSQKEAKTKCLLIFKEMIDKRNKPTAHHYASLLKVAEDENAAINLLEWCLQNNVTVLPLHWVALLRLFSRISVNPQDFQKKFTLLVNLMNKHHVGMANVLSYEPLRALNTFGLFEVGLGVYKNKLKYHHPPTVTEGVYILQCLRGVAMNLLREKQERPIDGAALDKEVEALRHLGKEVVTDIQTRCVNHMKSSPLFWESYIDLLIDTTDYQSAKSVLTMLLVDGSITTYRTEKRAVNELGMDPYMPDPTVPQSERSKQLREKGFSIDAPFQIRKNK